MTIEEWYVQLFKYGTGWLGYSINDTLDANVNDLELAIEGKFDFVKRTNPWRTQKDIDEEEFSKSIGPEGVAKKMEAWALAMQGRKPDKDRQRGPKAGIVLPPGMEMPTVPTGIPTKKE